MAKDKKSFLLYCDLQEVVIQLSDKKAGELFKHILSYVNDEDPKTDDPIINLAFTPVKLSLKRDLKKYEKIVDRNRKNGSKGGRPKNKTKPSGLIGNPKKPKKADSDSDTDSDSVKEYFVHKGLNESFLEFLEHRRQIKQPATPLAIKKLVKKLQTVNEATAIKMIDQSIENGWKGLFELKHKDKVQKTYEEMNEEERARARKGEYIYV